MISYLLLCTWGVGTPLTWGYLVKDDDNKTAVSRQNHQGGN